MTSILVSSDDDVLAADVAKRVAKALDFRHLGPEVLERVAAERGVPVEKLHRALSGSSVSRWGRKSRELLLSYVETAVLEELLRDSIVCWGLAAHLYARGVAHLLTTRVLADPRERARVLAKSDHIAVRKAWSRLAREDRQRTNWSVKHYGVDELAASNQDLTITLTRIDTTKAIELIASMASYRKLKRTTYSRKVLRQLGTASSLRSALLPRYSQVHVRVAGDTAVVWLKCSRAQKSHAVTEVEEIAGRVSGADGVQVHAVTSLRQLTEERETADLERVLGGADPTVVG